MPGSSNSSSVLRVASFVLCEPDPPSSQETHSHSIQPFIWAVLQLSLLPPSGRSPSGSLLVSGPLSKCLVLLNQTMWTAFSWEVEAGLMATYTVAFPVDFINQWIEGR